MATVIFVHGTSVRKNGYEASFAKIEKGLANAMERIKRPVAVADCLWGDSLGARLNMGGLTVPGYDESGGRAMVTMEDDEVLLWEMLGYAPLYELHGLAYGRASSYRCSTTASSPPRHGRSRRTI